jgi:predicted nucleotidyltransferase
MDPSSLEWWREAAKVVFGDSSVVLAYVFGSRVAGGARPDSDLDVGYYLPSAHPGLDLHEELLLEARLGWALKADVDLRNLRRAGLELRGRALEEGARLYCADPVFRVNLERDLLCFYHDYKPIFRAMHEERLRKQAQGG